MVQQLVLLITIDMYNLKKKGLEIHVCVYYCPYYIYIVLHDVMTSESTTKRKRCEEEERYSGATQSDIFIVESEDESQHPKRSKEG